MGNEEASAEDIMKELKENERSRAPRGGGEEVVSFILSEGNKACIVCKSGRGHARYCMYDFFCFSEETQGFLGLLFLIAHPR